MARINLLPWRAERQKQRQKQFLMMLALSAFAGIFLWFLVDSYYNAQISGQQERNAYLDQQITEAKAKTAEIQELEKKKSRLLSRKKVIEELQSNRSQMVHLFDSLVRTIPDGVTLTSIKQEGEKLTLEGRAQSNARVSTYMRNLETSGWMTNPDLAIIEAQGQDKGLPFIFKLAVILTNPNAPKDGKGKLGATTANTAGTAVNPAGAPGGLQTLSPAQPAVAASPAAPATAPASGAAPAAPAVAAPANARPANQPASAQPAAGGQKP